MKPLRHPVADLVLLVLWLAFLCAFPALKLSSEFVGRPRFSDPTADENREPAPFPDYLHASPAAWPAATEAWYGDNFAYRAEIVGFYNDVNLRILQSPVAQQVPGRDGWIFRRALLHADDPAQQGTWPEMEDCLGAFEATPEFLDNWRTLFEGRVAWAEAHGARYLEALTPVKAQVHPGHLPFQARLRHHSVGEAVEAALAGSRAATNVLFLRHGLAAAARSGETLYYREDHHVNPRGAYRVFAEIARAAAGPDGAGAEPPPFLPAPPADADDPDGPAACWVSPLEDRLHVRVPGSRAMRNPALGIAAPGGRGYPGMPVYVVQPGERRYLAIAHDSFLRFPLDSWRRKPPERFAVPFGPAFDRIAMLLFVRFTTPILERTVRDEVPDVIVEQFSESKLLFGPIRGSLDDTMRRAAAYGRAADVAGDGSGEGEGPFLALAVFERVETPDAEPATAVLLDAATGRPLATLPVPAGVRRAVFFPAVRGPFPRGLAPRLDGGTCASVRLTLRQ